MTTAFCLIMFFSIIFVAYFCLSDKPQRKTTNIHIGENKVVKLSQKDDEIHIVISDEEKNRQDGIREDIMRTSAELMPLNEDETFNDNIWLQLRNEKDPEKRAKILEALKALGYPNIDAQIAREKGEKPNCPVIRGNNAEISEKIYENNDGMAPVDE